MAKSYRVVKSGTVPWLMEVNVVKVTERQIQFTRQGSERVEREALNSDLVCHFKKKVDAEDFILASCSRVIENAERAIQTAREAKAQILMERN